MNEYIRPALQPVVSPPESQHAISFLGSLARLRLTGTQTAGALAISDNSAPRGNASPVHVHDHDDETFLVLEGELRIIIGEHEHVAGPGTVAVLPRRLRHAYVVTSVNARFITLHTPAGFETFAAELGEPAGATAPPPASSSSPDVSAIAAVAARFGITIVGPPPEA